MFQKIESTDIHTIRRGPAFRHARIVRVFLLAMLLPCFPASALGAGPVSEYYVIVPSSPPRLWVIQGESTIRNWALQGTGETAMAVLTDQIRTVGDRPGNFGLQYSLTGEFLGERYSNPGIQTMHDATTDGQYIYTITIASGDVYRLDLDWSHPEILFSLGNTGFGSITYDRTNHSLWIGTYTGPSQIQNRTMGGQLLSSFASNRDRNRSLALDPADDTLWVHTDNQINRFEQYSKTGQPLGGIFVAFNDSAYAGEFALLPIDCNSNAIPDRLDIAEGTSTDCDSNATPDECEGQLCIGACCLLDGSCRDGIGIAACADLGGLFQALGVACTAGPCDELTGACCLGTGGCLTLSRNDCGLIPGATWAGLATSCVLDEGVRLCPLGACCLADGGCADNLAELPCQSEGGAFQGFGSSCGSTECPQPVGACCLTTGTCLETPRAECDLFAGSTWAGGGTTCVDVGGTPTCPLGVCCLPDGSCLEDIVAAACADQDGDFRPGVGSCQAAQCPRPTGACCLSNGNCLELSQDDCVLFGSSTWAGANTRCADVGGTPTCPLGACCGADGSCSPSVTVSDCESAGGTFRGPGSTCANANCPQPPGACCLSSGNCILLRRADCQLAPDSRWAGPNTTCVDANSNGRADACESVPGDINGDGAANPGDIPPFIAVLLGTPQAPEHVARADMNGDGASDGRDIPLFITAIVGSR